MKIDTFLPSVIFASLVLVGTAHAADGYVMDSQGAVVRSGSGACWRTGYWTPALASAECDPELAPRPRTAEKPAAKASAPAPAPVPAKATTENMSLSADGLFAFGKATLLPAGQAKLDELAARIQGRAVQQILVIGHTDRLGSAKLNQRLSQQRAEAVKAYLAARNIDAGLIRSEGRGSAEPVTGPKQCPGQGGARVKACLAPDRRVEIKVTGLN